MTQNLTPEDVRHEERMLIDGRLRAAADGGTFEVENPATGEVAGVVANATARDMDDAIGAARTAFDTTEWATDRKLRQRCLRQLHDAITEEKEEMRLELVTEVGTPIMLTHLAQLDWPLSDGLLWPAEEIDSFPWERHLPTKPENPTNLRWVFKEPIGVVSAIIPWNFPFEILINKLGPALATGNTMVVKAASLDPWSATRIGRLIAEKTDIPAGVVNIVTARNRDVAQLAIGDPRVDMVSFTGSTATGQKILEYAAPTFKRTLMELGGKSAGIVLDDADLATAIPAAAAACMHAGQGCALPTRLLVHKSLYPQAVGILEQVYANLPIGDPMDPTTFCGPIITRKQRDKILGYIEAGKREGARLVVGGGIPTNLPEKGHWVQPTLFVDVDNMSTIAQEEIFGPVLAVTPFEDDDDAIRLANQSTYGLSGNVSTASPERALKVIRGVRTGSITANGGNFYSADSPYGGYKHSGIGRQGGIEGFETYLETKAVASTVPLPL
jgi:aldehyde dehydrogenase (NAD+)